MQYLILIKHVILKSMDPTKTRHDLIETRLRPDPTCQSMQQRQVGRLSSLSFIISFFLRILVCWVREMKERDQL